MSDLKLLTRAIFVDNVISMVVSRYSTLNDKKVDKCGSMVTMDI